MRVSLAGVVRSFGARTVLDRVDLTLGPRSRLGLVGPNGAGKSTVLRLLAALDEPDEGRVERTPASLTVGYLPQEHDRRTGETLLAYLARRTGVAEAEAAVERHTAYWSPDAYAAALERFLALGGADLEARARATCAELGLAVSLDQETATLSGGEAARAGLAVSTTSQPLTGSIQHQVFDWIGKARGSSSSATRSFSSFIALRPGRKPCCSSSSSALALAT